MRNLTFYIINLIILLPVLFLSFRSNVRPHKHIRGLAAGWLLVSIPSVILMSWATSAGYITFNSDFVTSFRLLSLPLEAILFAFILPFALIYVWGLVKKFIGDVGVAAILPLIVLAVLAGFSIWMLIYYWDSSFTRTVAMISLVAVAVAMWSRVAYTLRFWVFQLLLLGIFLVLGSIFSLMPMTTISAGSIMGFSVGGITAEEFLLAFSFANLFLIVFITADRPKLFNR